MVACCIILCVVFGFDFYDSKIRLDGVFTVCRNVVIDILSTTCSEHEAGMLNNSLKI